MKSFAILATVVLSGSLLSGCSSTLNIGESDFSCPGTVENGFKCMSIRDLYKATDGPSSGFGKRSAELGMSASDSSGAKKPVKLQQEEKGQVGYEPTPWMDKPLPIRSQAKVMRVWISPYEDDVGDLNAPGLVYTEIESRRWNVGEGLVKRPTRLAAMQIPGQVGGGQDGNDGKASAPFSVSGANGQPVGNLKNVTPKTNQNGQSGNKQQSGMMAQPMN
jgi:conjugal transfer pilus assembly protein TraV